MPQLTWDSVLLVILLGGGGLGFLLRKAKIIIYIIGTYLAYIVANELSLWVNRFLRIITSLDVSMFAVSFVVFFFLIVILAIEENYLNNQIDIPMGIMSNAEGALYGFLLAGLFITFTFSLMDSVTLYNIQQKSRLALYFSHEGVRLFFILFPILSIALSSVINRFKGS